MATLLALMAAVPTAYAQATPTLVSQRSVLIEGDVDDNVNTGGLDVLIRGTVSGNVSTEGGSVRLEGRVEGNMATGGGALAMGTEAGVDGNVQTGGGPVALGTGARIEGNVNSGGAPVALGEGARIDGEVCTGGGPLVLGPDAQIDREGCVSSAAMGAMGAIQAAQALAAPDGARAQSDESCATTFATAHAEEPSLLARIGGFCLMLLMVLGFRALLPERFAVARAEVVKQPARDAAVGFAAFAGLAVVTLGLAITVVGIPAAFVSGTALAGGGVLGAALSASVVGAALPITAWATGEHDTKRIAAGIAVLFALSWIPWVGSACLFAASCVGIGALVRTRQGQSPTDAGPYRTAA